MREGHLIRSLMEIVKAPKQAVDVDLGVEVLDLDVVLFVHRTNDI